MSEQDREQATVQFRRALFWNRVVMVSLLLVAFFIGNWELMQQRSKISDLQKMESLIQSKLEKGLVPRNQVNGQEEFVALMDRTPVEREWGIGMLTDEIGRSLRSENLGEVLPCPIPDDQQALLLMRRYHPRGLSVYNGGISARVVIELGVPVEPIVFQANNHQLPRAIDEDVLIQNHDESFKWMRADFEFPKNQWSQFRLNGPERVFQFNDSIVKALDFQTPPLSGWNSGRSNVDWSNLSAQKMGQLEEGLSFQAALGQRGVVRLYEFQLFDGDNRISNQGERKLIGWLRISLKLNDGA